MILWKLQGHLAFNNSLKNTRRWTIIDALKNTSWEVLLNLWKLQVEKFYWIEPVLPDFTQTWPRGGRRGTFRPRRWRNKICDLKKKRNRRRINLSVSRIWTSEFQKNCFSSKKNFVSSYFAVQASQWDFLPSASYTDTDTDTDSVLPKISKNNNRPTMKFCLACTITNQTAKTFNHYI